MRHEKIFKKEDGNKIMVDVSFWADFHKYYWQTEIYHCAPKKRTWVNIIDTNNYEYRRLSREDREKFEEQEKLKYATKEEIYAACLELWEKLKP